MQVTATTAQSYTNAFRAGKRFGVINAKRLVDRRREVFRLDWAFRWLEATRIGCSDNLAARNTTATKCHGETACVVVTATIPVNLWRTPKLTHHHNQCLLKQTTLCEVICECCEGTVQRWHVQLQGPEGVELWITDQSHSAPSTGASAQAAQSLRAPFNGKLIALHVQEGQQVKQGDAVLVIESMKLEHILCAPRDAVVHSLSASVGQQVGPGQVLVQWKDAA
jgi:biotin carboxyl carrier protein